MWAFWVRRRFKGPKVDLSHFEGSRGPVEALGNQAEGSN
jgi:hypothetical protein